MFGSTGHDLIARQIILIVLADRKLQPNQKMADKPRNSG